MLANLRLNLTHSHFTESQTVLFILYWQWTERVHHGPLYLCNTALVQKVIVLLLMVYEGRGHINNWLMVLLCACLCVSCGQTCWWKSGQRLSCYSLCSHCDSAVQGCKYHMFTSTVYGCCFSVWIVEFHKHVYVGHISKFRRHIFCMNKMMSNYVCLYVSIYIVITFF